MAGAPRRVARLRMSTHERDANPRDELPPSAKRTRVGGDDAPASSTAPCVSVLMPCRNAMPWLPDCVGSILAQVGLEEHGGLELIAVDDSSTDGSREWLDALAAALAARVDDAVGEPADTSATATATATAAPPPGSSADGDGADEPFPASMLGWESDAHTPLTVEQVAATAARGNSLVVLSVKAHGPSGQGKALNAAYAAAKADLVGEMESDDLRPPDAFAKLREALMNNPEWDCATSRVRLCGWQRPGMERWIEWQNAQVTGEAMRRARFIEIPALRASGLYRREALERVAMRDGREDDVSDGSPEDEPTSRHVEDEPSRPYRDLWVVDGVVADCAHDADPTYDAIGRKGRRPSGWWPVDADFWQRWFACGLVAGKVREPLYYWRQYPAQSTRTHDRCSLQQLRRCKAHFLLSQGGVARGRCVQVWGIGDTLAAWVDDLRGVLTGWDKSGFLARSPPASAASASGAAKLRAELLSKAARATVRAVEYRPGAPVGKKRLAREDEASREAVAEAGVKLDTLDGSALSPIRLFAFGMEKARRKVARTFPRFDAREGDDHWFVG